MIVIENVIWIDQRLNFKFSICSWKKPDAPLLCHQSPSGGRGTVAIMLEQVIQNYRNAKGWGFGESGQALSPPKINYNFHTIR